MGDGKTCVGENECATGTERCGGWGGTCTDSSYGYTCSCAAGFTNTGGSFPECQKQGTGLTLLRSWNGTPPGFSTYNFSTETPGTYEDLSSGDFYVNFESLDGKDKFFANNLGMQGVATVWLPGDDTPEPTSLSAIAVPPASAFTIFGREIILGGYYVSMARVDYPNYYIMMKVVGLTATEVSLDWVYVYRG